jgi:GNAT superfamily N-acetyltransferase
MAIKGERISFRRANLDDVEALIEYRIRFLHELGNYPNDAKTKIVKESLRTYFSRTISSDKFVAWLAEYDGRIIGTSAMVVWQRPARYGGLESGWAGYILNMYTIPEARKIGVCSRLLKELIEEARALGLTYLHLHASKDGEPIYRKAGFVEPDQPELELILNEGACE